MFPGYMFLVSQKHSLFPHFMQPLTVVGFFCRRYTSIFAVILNMLKMSLRALFSNSSVSCLKNGAQCFKWLRVSILEHLFQDIKFQRGNNGLQSLDNLHHTMSNVWFVWNHTKDLGLLKHAYHTLLHIMVSL